jgi:hypothetical protein
MKALIALEEMIKDDEIHLKLAKKQLSEHESGVNRLSALVKASTETNIEERTYRLEKNKEMLSELLKQDMKELEKQEKIKEAIERKNYFHYQKIRLKRDKLRTNDVKLEAMLIIDELPGDLGFEDEDLFRVAEQSLKMHLSLHEHLHETFREIRQDFEELTKDLKGEQIAELGLLNFQIPVVVLHLHTLLENIKSNLEEDNKKEAEKEGKEEEKEENLFPGFPKFEDWWIKELWVNHQAYFGLFKWKTIISKLCQSADQQRAWEVIFANWVNIKKQLTSKGALGFEYNFAFDTLIRNHCGLEEELATTSLESMKKIVDYLTSKEDFTQYLSPNEHELITKYTLFKRKKIDYKDVKGK